MNIEERLELIKRNTEEIITEGELIKLLKEKKNPVAYDGLTVTGPFHMGYLIPFGKMLDFERAGIKNIILIADIHSALDDLKAPWEELKKRSKYFKKCIELGFPWKKKPTFVLGSSFQLSKDYVNDLLKISSFTTVKRATRAASEVCRMKNTKVSELVYPLMQALDEEYLGVDIQLGGTDQRHILTFAREYLPKLGYKSRVEIMTSLMAGLKGPGIKMSSSVPESNIRVYDSEEDLKKKINSAYCPVGEIKDNPLIQLVQFLIFPIRKKFKIERDEKFGGDIIFYNYKEFERAFISRKLHPADLKSSLFKELVDIFSRVRKYFEKHKDQLRELGPNFV